MIYFTSDLHLGYANIIDLCGRPFSSVEVNGYEPVSFDEPIERKDRFRQAGALDRGDISIAEADSRLRSQQGDATCPSGA